MLTRYLLLPLAALIFLPGWTAAQMTPDKSPRAVVKQTIGLTEFTLDYSRPSARGREIFGGLLPYGELWRTGANSATTLAFTDPITINDQEIPAGEYAIFTIPGKETWTFILNSNAEQSGTRQYDQELDVLRMQVRPEQTGMHETMTLEFSNLRSNGADLVLVWENTRLSIPFMLDVRGLVDEKIESETGRVWLTLARAARYYADQGYNQEKGMELVEQSLLLKDDHYYNHYIKALLLSKMDGKMAEAKAVAKRAIELGDANPSNAYTDFYKGQIEQMLEN